MRLTHALLTVLALAPTLMSQMAVAYPGVMAPFPNFGSQDNHGTGALCISGQLIAHAAAQGPIQELMDENDPSMTAVWQLVAGAAPEDHKLQINGAIAAFPESPFTLAYVTQPGVFPCCNFGAWQPSDVQSGSFGTYHLGLGARPIWDGLGFFRTPDFYAMTDLQGGFPLHGAISLNTPEHVALQAMVIDVTSPSGLRLTAAFSITKYA